VTTTSFTRVLSMPIISSPSRGSRMIVRPRFSASVRSKPVSTTMVRSSLRIAQT
jgi:hypothetical protein